MESSVDRRPISKVINGPWLCRRSETTPQEKNPTSQRTCESVYQILRKNREWKTNVSLNTNLSSLSDPGRLQKGFIYMPRLGQVLRYKSVSEDLRVHTQFQIVSGKTCRVKVLKRKLEKQSDTKHGRISGGFYGVVS